MLEFGTELVAAEDKSIVALLGASPGASTAASIAVGVLETCFASELTESGWLPKLKEIIPTYGNDVPGCRRLPQDPRRDCSHAEGREYLIRLTNMKQARPAPNSKGSGKGVLSWHTFSPVAAAKL